MEATIRGSTCLFLEASRKWCHCHAFSHVYGMIILVI